MRTRAFHSYGDYVQNKGLSLIQSEQGTVTHLLKTKDCVIPIVIKGTDTPIIRTGDYHSYSQNKGLSLLQTYKWVASPKGIIILFTHCNKIIAQYKNSKFYLIFSSNRCQLLYFCYIICRKRFTCSMFLTLYNQNM